MSQASQMTPEQDAPDQVGTITIILADDHEIVRDGLRRIVEAEGDMEVVAEAGDADTARRRTSGLKPSVLVLDLNMPGEPSLASIPAILEGSPGTAVVVLTMQDDPAFAREAFRLGAKAFVVKHAAGAELVDAIRAAARGDTYINPLLGRPPRGRARGAARRPDPARDRGPAPGRGRLHESRDRRAAGDQHPHRRDPSRGDPSQAQHDQPRRGGRVRPRARAARRSVGPLGARGVADRRVADAADLPRLGYRQLGPHLGSAPRRGLDLELSAGERHSLLHADQAEAPLGRRRIEPPAVVGDDHLDTRLISAHRHRDPRLDRRA